jgi:hypothetical protein
MTDPRFPVGKFEWPGEVTAADRARYIQTIADLPSMMRSAVSGMSEAQLDTPYREGGWTVRQVVHHVPESHMNAYIRFKLALTENEPTVKPYDEAAWAMLNDVKEAPIEASLGLLDALHQRWVVLLRGIAEPDWKKTFRHPEIGVVRLENNLALYAWHSRHHLGHVTSVRQLSR